MLFDLIRSAGIDYLRLDRTKDKSYAFDHAFDERVTQREVFSGTAARVIPEVLRGANACVFAYGATGSGKTYTMMGAPAEGAPGVVLLTMDALFEQAALDEEHSLSVSVQYVEIYNEVIQDLLEPSNAALDVREAPGKGTRVAGASRVTVSSRAELEGLLYKGNLYRTTEATNVNEVSSRSHAVLTMHVETTQRFEERPATRCGKLSLIDLAGSERAAKTGNAGKRLNEGANINRSLLALANCINALADKTKRQGHVPYRDSKLTRLLKDSLGGACQTVMITNLSPASDTFDETLNSLKYANRAKNIRTKEMTVTVHRAPPVAEQLAMVRELRHSFGSLLPSAPPSGLASGLVSGPHGSGAALSRARPTPAPTLLTPTSSAAANGPRGGGLAWRLKAGGAPAATTPKSRTTPTSAGGPTLRGKSISTPTAPRSATAGYGGGGGRCGMHGGGGGGGGGTPLSARASRDLGRGLRRPAPSPPAPSQWSPLHSPPSIGRLPHASASARSTYADAAVDASRSARELDSHTHTPADQHAQAFADTRAPAAEAAAAADGERGGVWHSLPPHAAWVEAHSVLDQLESEAVRQPCSEHATPAQWPAAAPPNRLLLLRPVPCC